MARVVRAQPLTEDEVEDLYEWVDDVPLSRPKRNIARDFADGQLLAEVVMHLVPRMIDLHNYPSANSYNQKMSNWQTLNGIFQSAKVFRKMGFQLATEDIEACVNSQPDAIEKVLKLVRK